jgi:hypothetical protein
MASFHEFGNSIAKDGDNCVLFKPRKASGKQNMLSYADAIPNGLTD